MKKILIPLAIATLASAGLLQAEPLAVGADAPKDLKSVDQKGEPVDLGAAFQEGASLVYFYPKADTPGCTKQACNVRDANEKLAEAGIKVFGVSADTADDQMAFTKKYDLNFTLVADKGGEVISAFGVPTNAKGFASRQSFLIKDGKVIFHQPKANPLTQAEDAIAALNANG